jgi:hypothetical protein
MPHRSESGDAGAVQYHLTKLGRKEIRLIPEVYVIQAAMVAHNAILGFFDTVSGRSKSHRSLFMENFRNVGDSPRRAILPQTAGSATNHSDPHLTFPP